MRVFPKKMADMFKGGDASKIIGKSEDVGHAMFKIVEDMQAKRAISAKSVPEQAS